MALEFVGSLLLIIGLGMLQSYIEFMKRFLWASLLHALICHAHKVGPSWFLSLCKVSQVLRGLLAILAIRFYVIPVYMFGLCYDHVFAFDFFGWIGMLCWQTS